LGRGDGSAAWAVSAWWMAGWTVGLFPEPVQAEVFASPDTRVCGTLSPDGTAVRRADGIVVSGRWRAVAGARHSHWQQLVAIAAAPDGTPEPVLALVPVAELEVVADPQVALPGAGTASTVAAEVFVPAERVLRLGSVLRQRRRPAPGATAGYRAPLLAGAGPAPGRTLIGLAEGAPDDAFERLLAGRAGFLGRGRFTAAGRAATPGRATAPPAQPRLAGAATMTDQAETRAHRIASVVDAKEVSRTPWTVQER